MCARACAAPTQESVKLTPAGKGAESPRFDDEMKALTPTTEPAPIVTLEPSAVHEIQKGLSVPAVAT